jgi:hypothetical protein
MRSDAEQRAAFEAVLNKRLPFTKEDCQVLRENYTAASGIEGHLTSRMAVELIDAIRKLNRSSTVLAVVGIFVALVGAVLAGLQYLALHAPRVR